MSRVGRSGSVPLRLSGDWRGSRRVCHFSASVVDAGMVTDYDLVAASAEIGPSDGGPAHWPAPYPAGVLAVAGMFVAVCGTDVLGAAGFVPGGAGHMSALQQRLPEVTAR